MGKKNIWFKKKNGQKKGKKDTLAWSHCATSSNFYSTGGRNLKLVELYLPRIKRYIRGKLAGIWRWKP